MLISETLMSHKHQLRQVTMFDFHDFGLIFAGQMHCLPQRLKSTLFEIFSNGGCPKGTRSVEKISNNVDFSLWGNRATTWEYFLTFSSETKIMKIRHSAIVLTYFSIFNLILSCNHIACMHRYIFIIKKPNRNQSESILYHHDFGYFL